VRRPWTDADRGDQGRHLAEAPSLPLEILYLRSGGIPGWAEPRAVGHSLAREAELEGDP
jgi:hypothetical protein